MVPETELTLSNTTAQPSNANPLTSNVRSSGKFSRDFIPLGGGTWVGEDGGIEFQFSGFTPSYTAAQNRHTETAQAPANPNRPHK